MTGRLLTLLRSIRKVPMVRYYFYYYINIISKAHQGQHANTNLIHYFFIIISVLSSQ